jgi:glycosyltransferase involved in cell wall biosynthesis
MDHTFDRLVICSKSTWKPAIRREHALADLAAGRGHDVVFLERPRDVRVLLDPRQGPRWTASVLGRGPSFEPASGILVRQTACVAPAHRVSVAQLVDHVRLRHQLRVLGSLDGTTVVATVPWQWPAVAQAGARRRVFDCVDDWEALLPGREQTVKRLLTRVSEEADAVIVDSDNLSELFGGREVTVVPNGASIEVLAPPIRPLPRARRMVYLGTLSERLDVDLIAEVLDTLPDGWSLDLYGPCQYPRLGDRPGRELQELLASGRRVVWHGALERAQVAQALDAADVLVLPHHRFRSGTRLSTPSWRGEAMKFYDYAARARAIVSTNWADGLASVGPPCLRFSDSAQGFAGQVVEAADESPERLQAQRSWAEERNWGVRWASWSRAIFGKEETADV